MKPQVTKESLAQWIAELESQPHLSLKEERYMAVMRQLLSVHTQEPYAWEVKGIYCHTLEEAQKYVGEPEPLFDNYCLQ